MYYNVLHTNPYKQEKIQNKKRKLNVTTSHTHQLPTDNHTQVHSSPR